MPDLEHEEWARDRATQKERAHAQSILKKGHAPKKSVAADEQGVRAEKMKKNTEPEEDDEAGDDE